MTTGERSDLTGTVVDGRYRIGRRIGIGGTGVVFEAERLSDKHIVVIKTLRPCFLDHPDLGRRLRREAEVARNVIHPGIVPVLDEGTLEDGSPYIIMEKVRGESLSRILLRRTTLRVDETAVIAMRVASILHAAHLQGYTHRDVKPEHILLVVAAALDEGKIDNVLRAVFAASGCILGSFGAGIERGFLNPDHQPPVTGGKNATSRAGPSAAP